MAIDPRQFRSALGSFATGVTIVTTRDPAGGDIGLTVNSFNSVSLDPPMVLWSLASKSQNRRAFVEAGYFAVHVLAAEQAEFATRFASPVDRFQGLQIERGEGGVPLLAGCAARFQCRVVSCHAGGDHDIFVGEVISFEDFKRPALVFQAGRYAIAVDKPDLAAAAESRLREDEIIGRNSVSLMLARAHYQLQHALRTELEVYAVSEDEWHLLAAVALRGKCTATDLAGDFAVSGQRVIDADLQRLIERGLLVMPSAEQGPVELTEAGRKIALDIAAISKAVEEDGMTDLSFAEIAVLKQLLRKIVRKTRPTPNKPV